MSHKWKQHDSENLIIDLERRLEEAANRERTLLAKMESFEGLLSELEEYFDQRADGELTTDSPSMQPNEEADFLQRIRQKANAFHWRHVIKEGSQNLITPEWLKKRIESDPDCEVEAGILHPEAPRCETCNGDGYICTGDIENQGFEDCPECCHGAPSNWSELDGINQTLDAFLKKALIEEIAIKYQNAGMKFQQSRIHAETFVNDLIAKFVGVSL